MNSRLIKRLISVKKISICSVPRGVAFSLPMKYCSLVHLYWFFVWFKTKEEIYIQRVKEVACCLCFFTYKARLMKQLVSNGHAAAFEIHLARVNHPPCGGCAKKLYPSNTAQKCSRREEQDEKGAG
jgi:hypothetical protein